MSIEYSTEKNSQGIFDKVPFDKCGVLSDGSGTYSLTLNVDTAPAETFTIEPVSWTCTASTNTKVFTKI